MDICLTDFSIFSAVPGIELNLALHQQNTLTLEMLDWEYSTESSGLNCVHRQISRGYCKGLQMWHTHPTLKWKACNSILPHRKLSTSCQAEQIALLKAMNILATLEEAYGLWHVVFLSDCKLVLENLSLAKDNISRETTISNLSQKCTMSLHCTPSH